MSKLINTPFIIAIVTFLWYRRGRLWSFYYSIISQSLQQIKADSLNRKAWEKIALDNLDLLIKSLFSSLFEFEIEYLRNKIIDNKHLLWIGDSSISNEQLIDNQMNITWLQKKITIINKEDFCVHSLKKTFFSDFRFFGFGLFINSIIHRVRKKENTGYTEINF